MFKYRIYTIFKIFKFMAYLFLAIFLYLNIIEANGFAQLIGISNPSIEGMEMANFQIIRIVLGSTFLVILFETIEALIGAHLALKKQKEESIKINNS